MEDQKNNFKDIFSIEKRTKYFIPFIICICIISIVVFALLLINGKYLNEQNNSATKAKINYFENINLEGKGIVVWDVVNNKELFSKNSSEPLPLASLTKVMTAVTTDGKLKDDQEVKITKEDLKPEGDSKLVVGDTWRAGDLRDFTLLTSSNDGAFALAAVAESKEIPSYAISSQTDQIGGATSTDKEILRAQFIKEMNEIAFKIGLSNSKFFNEHGLDRSADRGGAYGSARDMAVLFEYVLKNYPEMLEATRYKNLEFKSNEQIYSAENTNTFIDKIPNVIASKTGFTDLAGGNLVIAFDAGLNRPIIISILGSTAEGRFADALKLVNATIKQLPDL
jgi:D-alanyl-D-alanine carboxypeptidase